MKLPIIISEEFDISIHSSLEHAKNFLEPFDVQNRIFAVYDSEGLLLELTIEFLKIERHFLFCKWISSSEKISIKEPDKKQYRVTELKEKLITYLKYSKKSTEDFHKYSIEELLRMVEKYMPWKIF